MDIAVVATTSSKTGPRIAEVLAGNRRRANKIAVGVNLIPNTLLAIVLVALRSNNNSNKTMCETHCHTPPPET